MSQEKRITLGYSYHVDNQDNSSYIAESYLNGIKDFIIEGDLEKLMSDSGQMINIIAKIHMNLEQNKNYSNEQKRWLNRNKEE